jgi:hypothetical protein
MPRGIETATQILHKIRGRRSYFTYARQTRGEVDRSKVSPHFTHVKVTLVGTDVPPQSRYRVPKKLYSRPV